MNLWDILILALVGAALFAGLKKLKKNRRSCCGNCTACGGSDTCVSGPGKPSGRTEKDSPAP